ncbi:MAG: hypothetical protein HeimC2_39230 [Candidatus Heimdallarchaeota archaeon LC_2]|nr:MAG: hypothetical protein HeimC2_39230 [Candidatus Heimdallarchaeota archaeon LC_2]
MSEEKDYKFEDTILKLFEKAGEDGLITDEEGAIIMGIKIDLDEFVKAVKMAEDDGIITLKEALELEELKNKIVVKAGIIAAKDYTIKEDEQKIIKKLIEILKNEY